LKRRGGNGQISAAGRRLIDPADRCRSRRCSPRLDRLRGGQAAARPPVVIDAQVHAYAANTPERPWPSVPNWPAHVTGDEMMAVMGNVGGNGAIYISPFQSKSAVKAHI
jgi:hypothetical protein